MNIGMTTFGSDGGRSGIGRYTINLVEQFSQLAHTTNFDLYTFKDESHIFHRSPGRMRSQLFSNRLRSPLWNISWHQTRLASWCRRLKHDVLFLPAGNRRLPARAPCPTVGTVHDFSSLHVTGKYDPARMFYIKQVLPFLVRRLSHVLTVSESSKRDIVEYANIAPERVTVTPLGVDHQKYRIDPVMASARLRRQHDLAQPFLLYVSRIEHPGKNHVRLIEAFEQLKSKTQIPHQLVLAGGDWSGAEVVRELAAKSRFADQILFTGFVPDDQLLDLYVCADVMVFPSLYEGFGLPVLEAMTSGIPVACANMSSLPEVAGDAASYFCPYSSEDIADAVGKLLFDTRFREQCVTRGIRRASAYTWKKTAKQTLDVLKAVSES